MRNCPPDKIINPYTGRCVSRTGRVGRQLLRGEEPRQQQQQQQQPRTGNDCPRPCDPTKICNPQSRRCVSRTGTIGRRLLRFNSPRRQSPPIIRPAATRPPPRPPTQTATRPGFFSFFAPSPPRATQNQAPPPRPGFFSLFAPWATQRPLSASPSPPRPPQNNNCPICRNTINRSNLEVTRCGHRFHGRCMNQWLRFGVRPTCPMCRNPNPRRT